MSVKKIVLSLFLLIACFNTIAIAQKLSPNTEAFLLRPVNSMTRSAFPNDITESFVKSYIQIKNSKAIEKIEKLGAVIYISTSDLLTASIPKDKLKEIAELEEVAYVQIASQVNLCMDKARAKGNVNKLHAGTDLSKAYAGTGIVVGIIDSGFEYNHVNFYDKNNERYRVQRVWEQNRSGKSPENFGYGTEYTTESEILRAATDTKSTTHGTHVTGIASGGDLTTDFYGIATDVDLVFVSYGQSNVDISNAIKYIYDYAESVNKPCVINMSIGSHIGPHDGTSLTDRLADELQGAGRLLVGAAGNEGGDQIHINYEFTPNSNTVKTMIKYENESRKSALVDIWGTKGSHFSVQGCIVSTLTGEIIETTDVISTNNANSQRFTFKDGTTLNGYITLSSTVNPYNERPNIYVESVMGALPTNRAVGLIVTAESGKLDMWNHGGSSFTNNSRMGWQSGNSNSTCGEIGGTGKRIVSVGAYISKSSFTTINGESYSYPDATPMDGIAGFSSKGPTSDGRMKPDITAPGMVLSSSVSSLATDFDKNMATAKTMRNMKTYYYGMNQGTSMAAPFVTGTLALWLEANPKLTPEDVRAILQKTAINDRQTGDIRNAGSNTWGYGKIDAYAGLVEAINFTGISETTMSDSSDIKFVLTSDHQNAELLFMEGDSNVRVQLFRTSGAAVLERNVGQVADGQNVILPLSSLEQGVYILKVTGEKLNKSIKFAL